MVAAFHDLHLAGLYCDEIYVLKDGRVRAAGAPWAVLTAPLIEEVYGVHADILPGKDGDVYKRQVFSVCGELVVRENNESCEMLDLPVRVTISLRAEQRCLLLSQLHLSLPSPDQDDAEFFPRLLVGENISTCLLYTSCWLL